MQPCVSCNLILALTDSFKVLYPSFSGVPYTSGAASVDTGMAQRNALWARYLNYKTGFSKTANDYATAYLSCGLDSGAANLILLNRSAQPPIGGGTPLLYTASISVSFDSSYSSNPGDEFETQLTATLPGTASAMCSLNPPVTYIPPPDTVTNPCQSIQDQANYIAQMLFQQQQDSLISNFDSLYRAKCLSAQRNEKFYATYRCCIKIAVFQRT